MKTIKKNPFFTSLFILIVFATSCTKTPIYKTSWQSTPEVIDGFDNDEPKGMYYDHKAKMVCWFSNDENNFYVNLKVVDKTTQKKIIVTGLTLWIDTLGKKEKLYGITYPMKTDVKKSIRAGSNLNQQHNIKISGFDKSGEDIIVNNRTSKNITVACKMDSLGTFFYEAGIPLNMLFSNPAEYLTDTTKMFSIGFETGSLEIPVAPSSGSMRGGMSKGGGGNRGGAGGPGGSGGGRGSGGSGNKSQKSAEMQAMAQASKFWIKNVRLSNGEE